MKANKLNVAVGAVLAMTAFGAGVAHAAPINVGGVVFDPDSLFDFTSQTNMFETTAFQTGDVISGYGQVNTLNATNQSTFCPTCELTYEFNGYTLVDLNPSDPTTGISPTGQFDFTGGWFNLYVDNAPNFDSLDKSTAQDGDLWLQMTGANGGWTAPITLSGNATGSNAAGLTGQGVGYLDVIGGLAAGNLNTNGQPGEAILHTPPPSSLSQAVMSSRTGAPLWQLTSVPTRFRLIRLRFQFRASYHSWASVF